jgi:hypothetical protein
MRLWRIVDWLKIICCSLKWICSSMVERPAFGGKVVGSIPISSTAPMARPSQVEKFVDVL